MRTRRNHLYAVLAGAVLLAAGCGSSDDGSGAPVVDPGDDGSADVTTITTAAGTTAPTESTAAPTTLPPAGEKPVVSLPDELPTDLVVTELVAGSGPAAEVGDTVTVNYVGVRSADGTEFDNSYDENRPFTLVLGSNTVIQGWEQGLIGARQGDRLQLDIPPTLAYGDQARGEVIRPGDALTFVVDVVAVEERPVVSAPEQADPGDCPATGGSEALQREFTEMQPFCIDVSKTYTAEVATNFGTFTIELDPERAPQNVNNFVTLARYKYFDGTECHRVLTDFVVQCGDPDASGFGGPGYTIPDELPLPGEYRLGSIAMANIGQPDSAGSQFFVITGDRGAALPPQYSLFGQVDEGLDVIAELNTLENPDGANGVPPLETITIETVTITET